MCTIGLIPRWVENIGQVGDLRPRVVRFPIHDVGTEEHLKVVDFVDIPIVVGSDVPSVTLGVGYFAANVVGVATIAGVLEVVELISRHSTFGTCCNLSTGLVDIDLVAISILAEQWRAPRVTHSELGTNLVPNLVVLSVSIVGVNVPVLGDIDSQAGIERHISVLNVSSVGCLHFVVRRADRTALFVVTHRIGAIPTIEVVPWVGSSRACGISITLVAHRVGETTMNAHILIDFGADASICIVATEIVLLRWSDKA